MLAKRPNRQAPAKMQHTRTVFTVLKGALVFTGGPQCEWFRVEVVVGNSNIGDGDINILASVASLALSQNGIPNALCVIVTIARSHTQVHGLRLDCALEMRGFAQALPLFTQLETLYLSENNLADEGVELLAKWLPAPFFIRHPSALDLRTGAFNMVRISSSTIVAYGTVHKP